MTFSAPTGSEVAALADKACRGRLIRPRPTPPPGHGGYVSGREHHPVGELIGQPFGRLVLDPDVKALHGCRERIPADEVVQRLVQIEQDRTRHGRHRGPPRTPVDEQGGPGHDEQPQDAVPPGHPQELPALRRIGAAPVRYRIERQMRHHPDRFGPHVPRPGLSAKQPGCHGAAPRVSHHVDMATEGKKMPVRAVAFWAWGGLLAVAGFWLNVLYTRTNVATGASSHPFGVVGWILWLAGLGFIAAAIEVNRS